MAMQWMGLYWFVVRKPFRYRQLWIPIGLVLAAYTFTYLAKISYTGNVINLPFVALCGFSAWTLWKYRSGPFAAVARVSAVASQRANVRGRIPRHSDQPELRAALENR